MTAAQGFQHQVAAADVHPFHRVRRIRLAGIGHERRGHALVAPDTQRFSSVGLTAQQGAGCKHATGQQQLPSGKTVHGGRLS
ncbi:hypothetical protein EJJ20_18000 [Pseudomonas poae]|nr:hypothetical protein EJJ20_18000 [Pseudomonas poae]